MNHGGTSWGYSSFISLYPDQNMGIFTALTGRDRYYMFQTALHNFLFDHALVQRVRPLYLPRPLVQEGDVPRSP